jgi:hypothetical protein
MADRGIYTKPCFVNSQLSTFNFQLPSIFHIENPKQIAIFAPNRQIKTKTQ